MISDSFKAAQDYLEKNVRSLKEDDPGKAYSCLKKMGAQPGDCSDEGSFSSPSFHISIYQGHQMKQLF